MAGSRRGWSTVALTAVIATAAGLTGCSAPAPQGPTQVIVGVVTSRTGAAALDGEDWTLGFQAGLDAATDGSGAVGGTELVVDYRDDASDPATATAETGDLLGEGATVLVGPVADDTALAVTDAAASGGALVVASATTDALTGLSRSVFRSSHQIAQEVAAATVAMGDVSGRSVAVIAPDDAAGQAFVAAAGAVVAARGATFVPVTPPADSSGFVGPIRDLVIPSPPAGVMVRWPGAGAPQLWRDAEGIPDALTDTVFTAQLGDVSGWGQYGAAADRVSFLSSWVPGAAPGAADTALIGWANNDATLLGPSAADGYLAALMVVKAVGDGGGAVDGMIAALEGATFDGPTGAVAIRASDHALIADEFRVRIDPSLGSGTADGAIPAADIAPPETPIPAETPGATG